MSRRDIGNYLRLVPETVSRQFSRFARDGLIAVDGQDVTLLQRQRLAEIGEPLGDL
ncbi:MAG: helix-turn-helix domain-containing protein [Gammaproteobacteria bacterium]